MSASSSDRNLLFGVLALQMDFLSRDALIAALNAWILDKTKPLGDILVEQHTLRADERDVLDALVQKHLDRHHGDVEKSLAAVAVPTPLREDLHNLADPDVQASVAHLPATSEADEPGPLPSTVSVAKPPSGLRYQILRPHDKGGIGEVFVALDQELNRHVALKEIQERHAADSHSRGRFVREAEITGGLEHPGIVPVYGLGQYADGRPFYAMRFIQGETLKDAIARYQRMSADASAARSPEFELRALLTRFVAVCNTIAYAHSRGVIHRDIKPSNIMLGKYGETLVVDWGMAKAGMNEPARSVSEGLPEPTLVPSLTDAIETQAGAAMGTPAYMSPEQASGRLDLLGPASDIYSLGATLYTLLTGQPPIEGKETAEVLRKAQRGEWLPPHQLKPDVPPALDAVCRKAMAPTASNRYLTALALAADVESCLADEPVSAYREPWMVRSRRWMRRHRTLVSTAVGVLVISLLATTVGLVFISDAWDREATARQAAENEKEEARKQKEEAEKQKKEAVRRRDEARFNQYVVQMNLVQREYEANNIGRVRELLEAQVPREPDAGNFRNFEWHYWQRMAHRELLILMGHKGRVNGVSFSPDGRRLASASYDRTVRVWDAATGQELLTLKGHTDRVYSLSFSPDGRQLASASKDGTVRVWDCDTGKEMLTLKGHTSGVHGVSFSPDGRRLASASSDQTVRVWDAARGQKLLTLEGHTDGVLSVSFSPDGRRLASASGDGKVLVWEAATGHELLALKGHMLGYRVSFSPDGRRLASASFDHTVRVWDATTGKELLTLTTKDPTNLVMGVSFSPDGRRLASAGIDRTVRVWDAATGQELLILKGHMDSVNGVSFSPDGLRLASAGDDQTARVWDSATGQELLTLAGHTDDVVMGVSFSPDGRLLASTEDDTVRVRAIATGEESLILKGHTHGVRDVCFTLDGRRLASASADRTVRVWDAATGNELLTLNGHTDGVMCVSFSPDGRRLASGGADRTVRVWDAASGQVLLTLRGSTRFFTGLSFSPDGRRLATASFNDKAVRIWDASTGQELNTFMGHTDSVRSVSFSPSGRLLASAGGDGTVRIWDADTGQALLTLKGHTNAVSSVSFSPDGRRLASVSADRTVRVWDTTSGHEMLTLKGYMRVDYGARLVRGASISFSPDGRRLAAGCYDHMIHVWETEAVPDEFWRRRWLVNYVPSLFEEFGLRQEVLASLRKEFALGEAEREFAVQLALTHPEDSAQLTQAA